MWDFTLKSKDHVFYVFANFHNVLERDNSKKLKSIHTNNGGEYIEEFHQYCIAQGICHEQSVPKTP